MNAKDKHREKLIEFLSNPENDFCPRCHLAEKIGIARQTMYKHFSAEELQDIEHEALELRRKRYSRHLAEVDQALLERAKTGDPSAVKLCYQRFENWSEKHIQPQREGKEIVLRWAGEEDERDVSENDPLSPALQELFDEVAGNKR